MHIHPSLPSSTYSCAHILDTFGLAFSSSVSLSANTPKSTPRRPVLKCRDDNGESDAQSEEEEAFETKNLKG
ncbi:hypothetical protein EIP91_001975 [Steccherinum ochraceum]|uniref:Uncharacterized protein n=1 Tax=Steccherinum ochraceum TaxID=92696 RepID=A0A4R0RJ92_9APHY|nr:hypothetical protein EIP91_001975 [Steccherinum ochraceum]